VTGKPNNRDVGRPAMEGEGGMAGNTAVVFPSGGLQLDGLRQSIDARLSALVPAMDAPPRRLNDAIRYSLLAPGKRIRPLLALATAGHFGADPGTALDAGCAIEMVHTASLILDDLPCMDDALERRGQHTNHRVHGEDIAILAAVALMSRAFGVLGAMEHGDPALRLALVGQLELAIGPQGLVAGQTRDLYERTLSDGLDKIAQINFEKTGVLFVLAVESGARLAGVNDHRLAHLRDFARHLGLAFQTLDDLLDQSGSAAAAGKDVGKDGMRATMASLEGPAAARALVHRHLQQALAAADACGCGQGRLHAFVDQVFTMAGNR